MHCLSSMAKRSHLVCQWLHIHDDHANHFIHVPCSDVFPLEGQFAPALIDTGRRSKRERCQARIRKFLASSGKY